MKREDITRKLTTILVEQLGCDADKITDEATLEDLGADSLDNLEVVMAVEEEFGINIEDDEAEKITTVGQMVEHIASAI
jgi:acyl carrier protein